MDGLGVVVGLVKAHADALADGNEREARECKRLLIENGLYPLTDVDTRPEAANAALAAFKTGFDAGQVKTARRIEAWGTLVTAPQDFTLHVLIGADGRYIGHCKVNGY